MKICRLLPAAYTLPSIWLQASARISSPIPQSLSCPSFAKKLLFSCGYTSVSEFIDFFSVNSQMLIFPVYLRQTHAYPAENR